MPELHIHPDTLPRLPASARAILRRSHTPSATLGGTVTFQMTRQDYQDFLAILRQQPLEMFPDTPGHTP